MSSTYVVKQVFATVQGEGYHAGTPAVFVRLAVCNIWSGYDADRQRDAERNMADCPRWCDTDFTREGALRMSAGEVAESVAGHASGETLVVVTGGEPLLQLDLPLVEALAGAGFEVAVETNGTVALSPEMRAACDRGLLWVTCSPKLVPQRLRLQVASELKVVVPDYAEWALEAAERLGPLHRFVQPRDPSELRTRPGSASRIAAAYPGRAVFDTVEYAAAAVCAADFARRHPGWRISTQTHKINGYR